MITGAKRATIVKVLSRKVTDWLDTLPEDIRNEIKNEVLVTGGAITSMLLGEKVNDYDIYLKTQAAAKVLAQYYVDLYCTEGQVAPIVKTTEDRVLLYVKSAGVLGTTEEDYRYFEQHPDDVGDQYLEALFKGAKTDIKGSYQPKYLSNNAITLSDRIQIIIRFYGTPEEIHENFDFVHATNVFDYKTKKLYLNPAALEATLARNLVYVGSLYPIASIFRIRKFIERGWRIHVGQLLKIIFQINKLNLSEFNVLQDQLIGVDAAYMSQLLARLDERQAVDLGYVSKLLDEIYE